MLYFCLYQNASLSPSEFRLLAPLANPDSTGITHFCSADVVNGRVCELGQTLRSNVEVHHGYDVLQNVTFALYLRGRGGTVSVTPLFVLCRSYAVDYLNDRDGQCVFTRMA